MEKLDSSSQASGTIDYLERLSRLAVLTAFAVAVISFLVAPLMALAWQQRPFPGFLVNQTLVVNRYSGGDWGPHLVGMSYPERVTRVAGQRVSNSRDYQNVIASFDSGERVQIFTETREGRGRLHPGIELIAFPTTDLLRMFWLPYFVGLAYLAIGTWIYRLRGATRPGRALSFFCVVTAIALALFFDLLTTHALTFIWTFAMALIGGALISLAWRFPEEWFPVRFEPAILALPYLVSIALAAWGFFTLYDVTHPWAYIPMWQACQRYAGLGSITFLVVMIYRAFAGHDAIVRQQARLMVVGSVLAFFPITIWFIVPLFNLTFAFDPALFLPSLILFPISIALAILRFQLWNIDEVVSYAFVYGASTAILAGLFAALTGLTQRMFVLTTGSKSDTAIIIITLIIGTAFTPLKAIIQKLVDRHLSEASGNLVPLRTFGKEVHTFVQMQDVNLLSKRLLTEVTEALGAESGMLSLIFNGQMHPVHTVGLWKNKVGISVSLEVDGEHFGLLQLGPQRDSRPYNEDESEALQEVAGQVSQAIRLAWPRFLEEHDEGTKYLEVMSPAPSSLPSQGQPVLAQKGRLTYR